MSKIGNKEYIDCPECPRCRPQPGLRNGVKWGICHGSGNLVYLESWREKKKLWIWMDQPHGIELWLI